MASPCNSACLSVPCVSLPHRHAHHETGFHGQTTPRNSRNAPLSILHSQPPARAGQPTKRTGACAGRLAQWGHPDGDLLPCGGSAHVGLGSQPLRCLTLCPRRLAGGGSLLRPVRLPDREATLARVPQDRHHPPRPIHAPPGVAHLATLLRCVCLCPALTGHRAVDPRQRLAGPPLPLQLLPRRSRPGRMVAEHRGTVLSVRPAPDPSRRLVFPVPDVVSLALAGLPPPPTRSPSPHPVGGAGPALGLLRPVCPDPSPHPHPCGWPVDGIVARQLRRGRQRSRSSEQRPDLGSGHQRCPLCQHLRDPAAGLAVFRSCPLLRLSDLVPAGQAATVQQAVRVSPLLPRVAALVWHVPQSPAPAQGSPCGRPCPTVGQPFSLLALGWGCPHPDGCLPGGGLCVLLPHRAPLPAPARPVAQQINQPGGGPGSPTSRPAGTPGGRGGCPHTHPPCGYYSGQRRR
jgi:hypothetical protein